MPTTAFGAATARSPPGNGTEWTSLSSSINTLVEVRRPLQRSDALCPHPPSAPLPVTSYPADD